MKHKIIKFTDSGEEEIGDFIINNDGSFFVDSEDIFLKNWLEELNGEEIMISEGIKGMNELGHEVYAEIGKIVKPGDSDFLNALQRYLPEDYFMLELLEEETQQRKTA